MKRIALLLLSLVACSAASSPYAYEHEEPQASEDELHFCRDDSALLSDRTKGLSPLVGANDIDVVASLAYPPGNVAVSSQGRVFLSYFPDTNYGPTKVGVLQNGSVAPFPNAKMQDAFTSVLGIRMDRQGRLWVLDHGNMGVVRPKLFAFDAQSGATVFQMELSTSAAPIGSMLNDIQIAPDGKTAYVSDASMIFHHPAIVVVDLQTKSARRVLEKHPSVMRGKWDPAIAGKRVRFAGLCADGGVDGIALDGNGDWLYYAPLNSGMIHRVPTKALRDPKANAAAAVEKFADATMTDGMITDLSGNVYLTDMEHSSVVRVKPDSSLELVARDARFRWPDGMSWGGDGNLYLSASALNETLSKIVRTETDVKKGGPYHLFRLGITGGTVGQ